MSKREDRREIDSKDSVKKEFPVKIPSESFHPENSKEVQVEHVSPPVKPYKPPIPYPQMLLKAKEEHKWKKFLEILKKFHINVPFLEAITDMPSYTKF